MRELNNQANVFSNISIFFKKAVYSCEALRRGCILIIHVPNYSLQKRGVYLAFEKNSNVNIRS